MWRVARSGRLERSNAWTRDCAGTVLSACDDFAPAGWAVFGFLRRTNSCLKSIALSGAAKGVAMSGQGRIGARPRRLTCHLSEIQRRRPTLRTGGGAKILL